MIENVIMKLQNILKRLYIIYNIMSDPPRTAEDHAHEGDIDLSLNNLTRNYSKNLKCRLINK